MSLRMFLALEIDEGARRRLADVAEKLGAEDAKVNWVAPENLHVTLNFLGELEDDLAFRVCNIAAAVAAEHEPFEFAVRGVACVPPSGRQLRMVWAGVDDADGCITALNDDLADAFGRLGLRQERREYRPHITLARIKSVRDAEAFRGAAAQWADEDFGPQSADEVVVFSSELTPEGPVYVPIARAPLGG